MVPFHQSSSSAESNYDLSILWPIAAINIINVVNIKLLKNIRVITYNKMYNLVTNRLQEVNYKYWRKTLQFEVPIDSFYYIVIITRLYEI